MENSAAESSAIPSRGSSRSVSRVGNGSTCVIYPFIIAARFNCTPPPLRSIGSIKRSYYRTCGFNTNPAKHYFCSRCGIYIHHQRRSNPKQYGVNVACLGGVSPFDFQELPVYDGTRHTADGFPMTRVGTLIFRAVEQGLSKPSSMCVMRVFSSESSSA